MKETIRECKWCNEVFTTTISKKVYCCASCQCQSMKERQRLVRAETKKAVHNRRCKRCGEDFTTIFHNQVYCCNDCQYQSTKEKAYSKKFPYWEVFNRDNFACQYCGRNPTNHGIVLHQDHIKPKADGGKDELDNLVTACDRCNALKGSRPLRYEAAFKKRLKGKKGAVIAQESFDFYRGMVDR